jgi:hypothetical protein
MKQLLAFLLLALVCGAGPASAAPITEAEFIKAEEGYFAAADANKNGKLDTPEEAKTAFLGSVLNMSDATRELCIKAGYGNMPRYTSPNPPKGLDGKFRVLSKDGFMALRMALFAGVDLDKNKIATDEEAKYFDKHMVEECRLRVGKALAPGSEEEKKAATIPVKKTAPAPATGRAAPADASAPVEEAPPAP